jgi:hypothetical protein
MGSSKVNVGGIWINGKQIRFDFNFGLGTNVLSELSGVQSEKHQAKYGQRRCLIQEAGIPVFF